MVVLTKPFVSVLSSVSNTFKSEASRAAAYCLLVKFCWCREHNNQFSFGLEMRMFRGRQNLPPSHQNLQHTFCPTAPPASRSPAASAESWRSPPPSIWIHGSWPLTDRLYQLLRHQRRCWPTGSAIVKLDSPGSFSSLLLSQNRKQPAPLL